MKGKADMLLANRSLSALVVVCLVLSALAGLAAFANSPIRGQAVGDLIVTGGVYTIENIEQKVDGNVEVYSGGELIVRDGTLSIISNYDPAQRHVITVDAGGTLTLEHGVVTTHLDQIDPWPFLTLSVLNGGELVATEGSLLQFPGTIVLAAGATVSLYDTTVTALPSELVVQYVVGSSGLITFDSADDGPAIAITDSTLELFDSTIDRLPEYPGDGAAASNLTLAGDSALLGVNSYLGVDFGPISQASDWYVHNVLVLDDNSDAYLYGCVLEPYVGNLADRAHAIVAPGGGADAYIYRWLNVTVGDEYGVPIRGATVTATFTGSELEGQEAVYYSTEGVLTYPPSAVLAYMGEDQSSFRVTGNDGIAVIPYLTDTIKLGQFVGSYALTGNATIDSVDYASTEAYSFPSYPAMDETDRIFDLTVEIIGVSASSPDLARWLVVPLEDSDTLTIEDMTYYHAGDIIVAAGGTLILRNAVLQLVQSQPNERTIYVDGPSGNAGTFIIEDSQVMSDLPIDLVVQGYGSVILRNSSMEGVNIVAKENAEVTMLDNSTMDGTITTWWDAWATIIVRDTALTQAPVLSGHTFGGFTNTSVPAIEVEDDAVAYIYRWIHVTVYDGAGYPLPNATVTIRYFANNTYAASAVSSYLAGELGVAKVNANGTLLTSEGSTFLGNYRVNVSYSFGGDTYYSDEFSVGVMPYTEPLEKNATYATVTIEEALPDMSVGVVDIVPDSPTKGQYTGVYATIENNGAVGAYNVVVDFYDDDDNETGTPTADEWFARTTVPWIGPDGAAIASATWIADYPLAGIGTHRIVAIVDMNNSIPEIGEPPVVIQMGVGYVVVQNLPDLEVRAGTAEIRAESTPVIVNKTTMILANIYNIGDYPVSGAEVNFYDSTTLIGSTNVSISAPNGVATAYLSHTFTTVGEHRIWVKVNEDHSIVELSYLNNDNVESIWVVPPPDLLLRDMMTDPPSSVSGGNKLNVTAVLENLQVAPFSSPVVKLYANYTDLGEDHSEVTSKTILQVFEFGDLPYTVWFNITVPVMSQTSTLSLTMIVNHDHVQTEVSYANNIRTLQVTVLDIRPDLTVAPDDIYVFRGGGEIDAEVFGRTVSVVATIHNDLGGRDASTNVVIGARLSGEYNYTIPGTASYYTVNASSFLNVTIPWTVNFTTPGTYEIFVWVDSAHAVNEQNEDNNFAARNFTINELDLDVEVSAEETEYDAGDTMIVRAEVAYANTNNEPVKNLPGITFVLVLNDQVIALSRSNVTTTNENGVANGFIRIPADLENGAYTIQAEILGETYDSDTDVQISAQVAGGLFPWWVWVLIIVAVVGVVAGFTVYTYVYGLGKLVECGECGAFIPAASKRCPKCGVEFEAGTMKCSECGAWIPAESPECPNCGVKFVGETEEEADYLERMKKEYDEMVSKYRELARPELGKKFSEKEFDAWWRKQPGYISFDDWLAKEEEKKKEGPVPCPVCGTLNPKEATVCHKCGTVFVAAKEVAPAERRGPPPSAPPSVERPVEAAQAPEQAPPGAAPAAAPRMVIRRPIEKKVVPKKIIKTPLGTEEKEGEGNEQ